MRTESRVCRVVTLLEERLDLPRLQLHTGLDCLFASHQLGNLSDRLIDDVRLRGVHAARVVGLYVFILVCTHPRRDRLYDLGCGASIEKHRDRVHGKLALAKGLNLEPEDLEAGDNSGNERYFVGLEPHNLGQHEALGNHLALVQSGENALVEYLLVQGVLIEDDERPFFFNNDELAQHLKRGRRAGSGR